MTTVDETTPRHFGANKLNYLAESHVGSSREAIGADLINKITYDDPDVFRHFRIVNVPHNFVKRCAASLETENGEDIALLKGVAATASNKLPDDLEEEEKANNNLAQSSNNGPAEEKKMYAPIVRDILHECSFPSEYFLSGSLVQSYHRTRWYPRTWQSRAHAKVCSEPTSLTLLASPASPASVPTLQYLWEA